MLSQEELNRYDRQILIPEIGREGQEKLKKAKVFVAGAGGLGSPTDAICSSCGVAGVSADPPAFVVPVFSVFIPLPSFWFMVRFLPCFSDQNLKTCVHGWSADHPWMLACPYLPTYRPVPDSLHPLAHARAAPARTLARPCACPFVVSHLARTS